MMLHTLLGQPLLSAARWTDIQGASSLIDVITWTLIIQVSDGQYIHILFMRPVCMYELNNSLLELHTYTTEYTLSALYLANSALYTSVQCALCIKTHVNKSLK